MASEEVQLAWKLSIAGAEDVKRRLSELHEQFNRGEISVEQYSKELNKQGGVLRTLTNQHALQNRLWLAQHPTINQLSRTLSGFNRVLSATTTAMTAINIAQLLMRTSSGQLIELQNQLAEAERNYNAAIDPEKKEEYARQIASIKAELEQANAQMAADKTQGIISFATSIALIGSSAIQTATQLKTSGTGFAIFSGGLRTATGALRSMWAALGPVGWAILALSIIIPLVIEYWDELAAAFGAFIDFIRPGFEWLAGQFLSGFQALWEGAGKFLESFVKGAVDAWDGFVSGLEDIWLGLQAGFEAMWLGVVAMSQSFMDFLQGAFTAFWDSVKNLTTNAANSVVNTVSGMVNSIIASVRNALDWLAKLPGNVASGISNFLSGNPSPPPSSGSSGIKKGATGLHTIADKPMLFLAGEAGQPEEVTIRPIGRTGTSTTTTTPTINIYVEGSIHAERDLEQVLDRYGIREARRRGWKA